MHAATLPTPTPPNASFGYGTAFVRIPGTMQVLFGWIEGQKKHRLARWDLLSGAWEAIPTLGLPRDAIFEDDRAIVLTTHGLHEVRLNPLKSLSERPDDVPEWSLRMARIPGTNDALVWRRKGKTCVRVPLDRGGSRRVQRPAPNLLTEEGMALSFERGVAFRAAQPRETLEIPYASAAIEIDRRIYIAPGELGAARNVSPTMQTDEVFDVRGDGAIVEYSVESGVGKRRVDVGAEVVGFDGPTRSGHLIVRVPEQLLWVDLAKGKVVARRKVIAGSVCVLDDVVLVPPYEGDLPAQLFGVGDSAKATMASFVPPRPPDPPKRARVRPAGTIADRFFKSVELKGKLGPAHFHSCEFQHCRIDDPKGPSEVRGVTFERCTFAGNYIRDAKVIDCRFEHVKLRGGWTSIEGVDLVRVVLAGPIDGVLVFQDLPDEMLTRTGVDDWALDISQGQFSGLELRGMPSRLVRRDPETQVVVRRARALDERWKTLEIGSYSIPLEDLVAGDVEDVVLVARRRGRRFEEEMAALRLLRSEGIAEPD